MTTTQDLQRDYYSSQQECINAPKNNGQTNPRYKYFTQTQFTVGDEEQFEQYREPTNGNPCPSEIPLTDNIFGDENLPIWDKYKDVDATAVINTFRYIFNKFKKGIFVKIQNGKLKVFLPFSKAHFSNEWSQKIQVKYGTINDFIKDLTEKAGYRFNPKSINPNINEWYANNCLIRYDLTWSNGVRAPTEGESNVGNVKNMLEVLCANRKVPDIEFFINRRDFPLITRNGTEPYNNIWDGHIPLISHLYQKYCPILSMTTSDIYADVAMPTWEDWARIQGPRNVWFPKSCRNYNENFNNNWISKKPTAVFRGGTTGCGVTIDTNPRLKVSYISSKGEKDSDGIPYLDAGITNWNLRARKIQGQKYLQTIDVERLPFGLVPKLSPTEQSNYKYIINVPGHVAAFRLSIELNMGSVVLLVDSPWKLWYSSLLEPYEHYVPVKADLSDLIDKIKWCRENDDKCQQIVANAKAFFNKYLQFDGVLDFMKKTLVQYKKAMGTYIYNIQTPLDIQIIDEFNELSLNYPKTEKKYTDITSIPLMSRCKGILQGLQWIINMTLKSGVLYNFLKQETLITKNKLGIINRYNFIGFPLTIKTTSDSIKRKENIHDVYIGTHATNYLINYIPNFVYIFGLYTPREDTNMVISEYIQGITLEEYINHHTFNFEHFLLIIVQLCYALHMAQQHCSFVHYDLTPWNIIIQKTSQIQTIDYIVSHENIIRISTTLIPVIIDYGKSHAIVEGKHHGYINMFHSSTVQDILSLLVTTIDKIINRTDSRGTYRSLPYLSKVLQLANFMSGTTYRPAKFTNIDDLRQFINKARKYSNIITKDKGDIENKNPLDLVNHIMKLEGNNELQKSILKIQPNEYKSSTNKGNGKQVFDYILSRTIDDKINSYLNVFKTLKMCTIPQPTNIFFIYYAAQTLETNIDEVYHNMVKFMNHFQLDIKPYEKFYIYSKEFIDLVYKPKIKDAEEQNIDYILEHDFSNLKSAEYDEETFLNPQLILEYLQENPNNYTDLTDYKDIIELILVARGTYKLSDKIKDYYIHNFNKLLNINTFYMQTTIANTRTLNYIAKQIYSRDNDFMSKYTCPPAIKYIDIYKQIFSLLKKQ
jgi:hypothetical protein